MPNVTNRERAAKTIMSVYERVGGEEYLSALTIMELTNEVTAALEAAEARGRAAGIEEAAKAVEDKWRIGFSPFHTIASQVMAEHIRSLLSKRDEVKNG